jgi:hypothetical protein
LWSARALAKSGKLVEASERYLVVSRLDASGDIAVQNQAKADAATEREALLPKIPSLTIDAKGASAAAAFTLDGAPLQRALLNVRQPANPGRHTLSVRDGNKVLEREVTLTEGQRLTATLDMAEAKVGSAAAASAAPATEPSTAPSARTSNPPATDTAVPAEKPSAGLPTGFWVGVGIAGVGLATGGISAGLAAQKRGDLGCSGNTCDPSKQNGVNSYNRLLTISTIGFVAAGVGAATAGVFLLTRPQPAQQARYISPFVGVGSAGVVGAF